MALLANLLGDAYRDNMSAAEIEAALEAVGVVRTDDTRESKEVERLKAALSKANSESADWKKKLREKQSEEERKKAEEDEKLRELQSKYDVLYRENELGKLRSRFMALGYDEALATDTAEVMLSGDTDKVFANLKKYQELKEKELRAAIMLETPTPASGKASAARDYAREIEEAQSRGDMVAAVALMREQQESTMY